MGSEGDAVQEPNLQSLAKPGSMFSLTLDEVQNKLSNLGKPLGSMNLDELLKSIDYGGAPQNHSASSLPGQESLTLSRDLSKKTVYEVWKDIQLKKNDKEEEQWTNDPETQVTLGEMTLEEFLARAGVVADSFLVPQQNNQQQQNPWMQFQLPSGQQPQQQHEDHMMSAFMPSHSIQQPMALSMMEGPYGDVQMNMSPSSLMGTLSDTQSAAGRKRAAPGGDVVEKTVERRHKRMIKNRESAARSRARKQAYTHELEIKVSCLEEENEILRRQSELDKVLPSAPPIEPKHQLRRTSSAPLIFFQSLHNG
ncbi:bZIP transcription factor bZIP7 [Tripterygium wilfordii]|uniref:BZIP transcription factor bZIP7 n=1 Tax=Tripterygium wilfordii TaxID=458696 RepID=A0A7J7DW10_TRIWF|nr:ABSCISIC ACID-INSENSITIVE 5-like protein 3 [Tripterygium wilfordii]XP_038691502.1 ABSCISIC ACID-INSENSITIVE 5-like protein 3 [Tripterygium wilfordii]XP_038691510.1 ABSCISIC ACID-INSENSITIVE 5-like protein 3 [Tripterygium wilfordii]KAF5750344.1 bZIP transcription factor bZIP7 [Tripterygium wilfordii]